MPLVGRSDVTSSVWPSTPKNVEGKPRPVRIRRGREGRRVAESMAWPDLFMARVADRAAMCRGLAAVNALKIAKVYYVLENCFVKGFFKKGKEVLVYVMAVASLTTTPPENFIAV